MSIVTDTSSDATHGDTSMITPEMIERFRQTGLRLDREGRLWHEGAEIAHAGLRRAILRWLDRRDDGRPIIRLDERRYAYIDVEDAELLALSARWDGDRLWLALNDGSEEELAYASLEIGAHDALYCAARGGRLRARITTPAYYVLARGIQPDTGTEQAGGRGAEADEGSFVLVARGARFPIRRRIA
jgi:uncharacterized protein